MTVFVPIPCLMVRMLILSVADKAYNTNAILDKIAQMGATAVIPPKANCLEQRAHDKHYYKDRNLVERFFCKLKQFRGIATRYCKRGIYFLTSAKFEIISNS